MRLSARADSRSRPKGFSTTTRAPFAAPERRSSFDDRREQARRDRQVVERPLGAAQRLAQPIERVRIFVVAVDVAKQTRELGEGGRVDTAAVRLEAVARARAKLIEVPARLGHADDGHVEATTLDQGLQRREDHLVRQVAGRAEEDQRVRRLSGVHDSVLPASGLVLRPRHREPPSEILSTNRAGSRPHDG